MVTRLESQLRSVVAPDGIVLSFLLVFYLWLDEAIVHTETRPIISTPLGIEPRLPA